MASLNTSLTTPRAPLLLAGGESRDVPGVMEAFRAEIARLQRDGVDQTLFENTRRSYYGAMLRVCGSFSSLAQSLVGGLFSGWCPLDVFEELQAVKAEELQAFILEWLAPEKLALSVVHPL